MPEGHTIHALAARLRRAFEGRPVGAASPQGRFADGAARLDGLVLTGATAVGKHLFVSFAAPGQSRIQGKAGSSSGPWLDARAAASGDPRDLRGARDRSDGSDGRDVGEELLHVHLGLIGQFPVRPIEQGGPGEPVGAVRLRLVGEHHVADLRGPMICALITPDRLDEVVATLGPDPLDPLADGGRAWERVTASRKPVAELLMNQSFIAGVGNVYRCEVLHRHRIDPFVPGRDLSPDAWDRIWGDLVELLPLGVSFSQILTMDDQVSEAQLLVDAGTAAEHELTLTGERLGDWFERRFHVYKRTGERCHRCGGIISAEPIAGRTLYWCPACQTEH